MANLPEPDWLALSESFGRATQAFDAEPSAVETALVAAFHDWKIRTRGRCYTYFGHDMPHGLEKYTWNRANVAWEANEFTIPSNQVGRKVHIFSDVVVHREDLEKWINGATPDSQNEPQEAVETPVPEEPEDEPAPPRKKPAEPDSSDEAGNQKSRVGNPTYIRGPYYEPLKKRLHSQANILEKKGQTLRLWFEGLRPREFCKSVKPALGEIDLPTDRTLYDAGRKIVAEIEER